MMREPNPSSMDRRIRKRPYGAPGIERRKVSAGGYWQGVVNARRNWHSRRRSKRTQPLRTNPHRFLTTGLARQFQPLKIISQINRVEFHQKINRSSRINSQNSINKLFAGHHDQDTPLSSCDGWGLPSSADMLIKSASHPGMKKRIPNSGKIARILRSIAYSQPWLLWLVE